MTSHVGGPVVRGRDRVGVSGRLVSPLWDGAVALRPDGARLSLLMHRRAADEAVRRVGSVPAPLALLISELEHALTASAGGTTEYRDGGRPASSVVVERGSTTTAEAAEILGCSPRWVRTIAASLGGRRVGRVWVFDRVAVVAYRELQERDRDNG